MKNLSIAFVWHFHQPVYQQNPQGDFIMPWARLHAVKDYLDMLLILKKYPKIKLNFNFVPSLLDTIIAYTQEGKHDIHSRLSLMKVEDISPQDKEFILNNFFDANYSNMILHHNEFAKLYAKRFSKEDIDINDFTLQEYSDIMALFNLAWMDPIYKALYPEIATAAKKESGFTYEERCSIINMQLDIMSKIIPTYKKYWEEGKIEISTSPYYHPILPILLDIKANEKNIDGQSTPSGKFNMAQDAATQVEAGLNRIEEIFGKRPKGIWPSEHCISEKTLQLLTKLGVQWTISDEGVLANSLNKEFIRDFRGNLEDPYELCKFHEFDTKEGNIDIIFRDAFIANLIGFEYGHHDSVIAANDLYERIKNIQDKLKNSPRNHHLLTIALDGENCWESYVNDGGDFLSELYRLIENDNTLQTVTISDHLTKIKHHEKIKRIHPGSWINRNFSLWIGEPTKNLAWTYLDHANETFRRVEKKLDKATRSLAKKELFISQGSDWFWWYGEPNDSGADEIFDYLFREHLKNIYRIIGEKIPDYLDVPLISFLGKPSKYPKKSFTPKIEGELQPAQCWDNAGCIEIPDSPSFSQNKVIKTIYFGNDKDNIYFRFELNKDQIETSRFFAGNQIYIYFKNANSLCPKSSLRVVNKTETSFSILREQFSTEAKISFSKDEIINYQLSQSMKDGLWVIKLLDKSKLAYNESLEVSISFDDLDVEKGENIEFFIINSKKSLIEEFFPQDILLSLQRPSGQNGQ